MDLDTVVTGDCVATLAALPAGFADLVFADPPFNIGYQYDVYNDRTPRADYLAWADRWLAAAVRALKAHGSLFLAIGDEYAAEYKVRLDALGLTMRNWLVWHYTFGLHQNRKFGRDHAHILYYTAHPKKFTFNADAIRIQSERQRSGDKRANPQGRVPGDVWSFPRLVGNAKERTGHPCQTPVALMERVVLACSKRGDLVLDPFAGSGTTLVAAKRHGRRFVGCELSENYAGMIRKRLDQTQEIQGNGVV